MPARPWSGPRREYVRKKDSTMTEVSLDQFMPVLLSAARVVAQVVLCAGTEAVGRDSHQDRQDDRDRAGRVGEYARYRFLITRPLQDYPGLTIHLPPRRCASVLTGMESERFGRLAWRELS